MSKNLFQVAAFFVLATAGAAQAQPSTGASKLAVVARIDGPDGHWDYASYDARRGRVYVSHGDEVMVVDAATGRLNPAFAKGDGLHAIVAIPGSKLLLTTNSGDKSARLIDAATGALIVSIPTPPDTDGAVYDPSTGLVLVICGDSGKVLVVNPKTRKAVGEINVGDALEFGAVDGKGRFFVNLVRKNEVAVVDIASRNAFARYPLAGCVHPTGLAYVAGDRLVDACGSGAAKILAADTGAEIATLKIGGFPDAVLYDPNRKLALIPSALSGTLAVIALSGAANNTLIDTVPTQIGARTGAVDPVTGRVWLPTAHYLPASTPGQRPEPMPGTFQILVLDRR